MWQNNYRSLIKVFSCFVVVFVLSTSLFSITDVKNVSIYEFPRPNFTSQNIRKHSPRPYIIIRIFTPHFVIHILPSEFSHLHFAIQIL